MLSPNNIGGFCICVQFSGENEEVVTEAIDVGGETFVHGDTCLLQTDDAAFCTTTDSAADVADGGGAATAREDELMEWGKQGVDVVNLCLNTLHHLRGNGAAGADGALGIVGGQVAAYGEEPALYRGEEVDVPLVGAVGDEQSDL